MPKKRRNIGSSKKGFCTRTRVFELMLTTAGVTRSSIGASEGSAWPSIAGGSAALAHGDETGERETQREQRRGADRETAESNACGASRMRNSCRRVGWAALETAKNASRFQPARAQALRRSAFRFKRTRQAAALAFKTLYIGVDRAYVTCPRHAQDVVVRWLRLKQPLGLPDRMGGGPVLRSGGIEDPR